MSMTTQPTTPCPWERSTATPCPSMRSVPSLFHRQESWGLYWEPHSQLLSSEPSHLYFIVHVCLGSVRHRLKEPGQALMKNMESHFASCSLVLKKTRTTKSHLRSRWHPTSRRARCSWDSPCILEVASMPASHTRTSPSIMANLTWLSLVVSWERWLGPFPARFFLLCLLFAHPTNIW